MGGASAGDITLHYVRPHIVSVSLAISNGAYYDNLPEIGNEAYGSGWRFEANYFDLEPPIHKNCFRENILTLMDKEGRPTYFPFTKFGNVLQGYFFPFSLAGLKVIRESFSTRWPEWIP